MVLGILLFLAGLFSGAINSIAGGGSFIIYPALLAAGVTPIMADATTSVIVLPGIASSALGYRKYIRKIPRRYMWFNVPVFLGTIVGAVLLINTPNATFSVLAPIFIIFATVLLAVQPRLRRKITAVENMSGKNIVLFGLLASGFFVLAIYGGYFGAGFSIVALAFIGFSGITKINEMNGMKNLLGITMGVVSTAYFIAHDLIYWPIVPIFLAGNILGGYFGAYYLSKLPEKVTRGIVIAIGTIVAVVLLVTMKW